MSTLTGKIVADFRTSLATELAVGGTTATLQSATDDDGVALPAGNYYFTVDGNNSQKEHFAVTLSGTALTAIKSVSRQGVQASGAVRKHRIGASVVITDFAHIQVINDLINGTTDLNASDPLKYDGVATISDDAHLATKKYVDDTAVAGAPDATTGVKGLVEIATGAELAAGTGTGGTGAAVVPAGSSFKNTSAGAGDANKVPVLDAAGVLDNTFMPTTLNRTADSLQISTDPDSANDAVRKSYLDFRVDRLFYGDGSDGALSISSGTTTLNTANKNVYQYTSVSITGTAALTVGANLQNLVTYIYVQGNLTITSSTNPAVNLDGFGGTGGAGGQSNPASGVNYPGVQPLGYPLLLSTMGGQIGASAGTHGQGGGGGAGWGNAGTAGGNGGGTGGAGGTSPYNQISVVKSDTGLFLQYAAPGAGGAGGHAGNNVPNGAGGNGGNGGGAMVFIVGGNINLTSTLTAKGIAGGNGGTGGSSSGGGGGGGGGGSFIVLYAGSVTANSATFTVTGGTGGTPGTSAGAGGAGGTGFSAVKKIEVIQSLLI